MIFWVPIDELEIMQTIECGGIEMMGLGLGFRVQEFGVYVVYLLMQTKRIG
jgi:hypothetical protein